jgi:hypothetical protein
MRQLHCYECKEAVYISLNISNFIAMYTTPNAYAPIDLFGNDAKRGKALM